MKNETPEFNMPLSIWDLKDLILKEFGEHKGAHIVYNRHWHAMRVTDVGKKFHKYRLRYQIPLDILTNPNAQIRLIEPQGHVASRVKDCCIDVKKALKQHIGEVPDFLDLVLKAFPESKMGDYDKGFGYVKFALHRKRYAVSPLILIKPWDVKTTVREIVFGFMYIYPTKNSEKIRQKLIRFFERRKYPDMIL